MAPDAANVPAWHTEPTQLLCPELLWYWPGAQEIQDLCPELLWYWPGSQETQELCSELLWYWPGSQASQLAGSRDSELPGENRPG
eukprot:COSAG02_NODE_17444_length_1003_cov_1.044248_1_plen_85_part_00